MAMLSNLVLCSKCHGDRLAQLSKPPKNKDDVVVDCMYRWVYVPQSCKYCEEVSCFSTFWPLAPVSMRKFKVFVSTRLVVDHREIALKHHASVARGEKGSNYQQALAALLSQEQDLKTREALLVLGPHILTGEYDRHKAAVPDGSWFGMRYGFVCGTTFQHHITDHDTIVEAASKDSAAPEESNPTEPNSPRSFVTAVEEQVECELQKSAYADGGSIKSEVVRCEGHTDALCRGNPFKAAEECGERVARPRFPDMTDSPVHYFSNHPENVLSGEKMRNVGVGDHQPYPAEARKRDLVVKLVKEMMFSESDCKRALMELGNLKSVLPKKFTEAQKDKMVSDSLSESSAPDLQHVFEAFVKKEVSAKPKPRDVVNHGPRRLTALATVAAVFEKIIFKRLKYASIKGRAKKQALTEIALNMAKVAGTSIENDLTAFEFGISKALKDAEADILRHIAKQLGCLEANEINSMEVDKVLDERGMACKWKFGFKAADGSMEYIYLELPTVIRESGDRLTSSGNWFQNFLAWLTFLVAEKHMKSAIMDWLKNQGRKFHYISARDEKKYVAVLAFEGDDTLGKLQENVAGQAELFFARWGWKPKLKYVSDAAGDASLVFVGYEMLLSNGQPVLEDAQVVCFPELKRALKTKQWSTMVGSDEAFKHATNVYAKIMSHEYSGLAPMHAFYTALERDTRDHGDEGKLCEDIVRDHSLRSTGDINFDSARCELDSLQVAELNESPGMKRLARVAGGHWTAAEWASACSLHSLKMTGAELKSLFISSWVQ